MQWTKKSKNETERNFCRVFAFLINCPHPWVRGTGEKEKEMLKWQCCSKTVPVNTELCDRKYWSRNDRYLWDSSFIAKYTISIVCVTLFTQFCKSQENDILSSDRLERYIANIASLDRWLVNIGNNHIIWSMSLKNKEIVALAIANLVKWKTMKNTLNNHENQPETMNNHRYTLENHEYNQKRW